MDSSTVTDPESLPIFSDPGRRTGAALAGLTTRPARRKHLWHLLRWSIRHRSVVQGIGRAAGSNSASQWITDKSEHELRIAGRASRMCSSTMETILNGWPSMVQSNWKSVAHTRFGPSAIGPVGDLMTRDEVRCPYLHLRSP